MIRRAKTMEEAKELVRKHPEGIILDVREEEEFITGHLEGAVLLPLSALDDSRVREAVPNKDAPVFLYCRSGRRSGEAAQRLEAMGYRRLYDLGGLAGWPYGLVTW